MVRSDIIEQLVIEHPELNAQSVEAAVKAFFAEVTEHLAKGGRVEMRGFGSFSVRVRNDRFVRNPNTGKRFAKPLTPMPFFRPGKPLAQRIRNQA